MTLSRPLFEQLMSHSGVSNGDTVIITGFGKHLVELIPVTRLYWTLKYYGHKKVAILDGGTARWQSEKRVLEKSSKRPRSTAYHVTQVNSDILVTMDDLSGDHSGMESQLLDARGLEYYEGEAVNKTFVSSSGRGHIPGALSLPVAPLVRERESGVQFQDLDESVEMAEMMDIELNNPSIIYCDTGNYASLEWFLVHELLGNKKARLFDGSMHQWSRFDKPVKRGADP